MIYIGTSGYSYPDWVGPFYPEGTKPSRMLKYYSQEFNFSELNSTYYRVPEPKNFYRMAEETPYDFSFAVKLFGGMTHSMDCSERDYAKFLEGIENLVQCDKLKVLVAQFPNRFSYENKNLEYLKSMRERFREYPLVMEFRNNTMLNVRVLDFLRENEIGLVSVDEPNINGLLPSKLISTGKVQYIRFHGRNTASWYNNKASHERYDYLYSEKELREWSGPILNMGHSRDDLYISFNNHFNGQAIVNARNMKKLLGLGETNIFKL